MAYNSFNQFPIDKYLKLWTSLAVQWLELCAFTAEGLGSVPGWGTEIPQAMWHGQRRNSRQKNTQIIFILKI